MVLFKRTPPLWWGSPTANSRRAPLHSALFAENKFSPAKKYLVFDTLGNREAPWQIKIRLLNSDLFARFIESIAKLLKERNERFQYRFVLLYIRLNDLLTEILVECSEIVCDLVIFL